MRKFASHRNIDPHVASARGRLAAAKRDHPERDHSEIEADLAEAKIAAFVRKVLAAAPTLTAEQRARITTLVNDHG